MFAAGVALRVAFLTVSGRSSALSGWVTLTFNSVCSALVSPLLYRLGVELSGERLGRRAGWSWALFPYAIYWPTRIVWDTSLVACLLALAVIGTVRLGRSASWPRWLGFGLLWGLLALTNPATLAFAPAAWLWAAAEQRRRDARAFRPALAAALVALLCVTPWLVRNYRTFGRFVFIRGNFGEELRLGNGPGNGGEWMVWLHPTQNGQEFDRYRRMGEVAYVASRGREAVDSIAREPAVFLASTARRVYWFWCGTIHGEAGDPASVLRNFAFAVSSLLSFAGLGRLARARPREAVLFGALLLLFPLVYYVTFTIPRYRHPIEPEMLLLIVYAISR